MKDIKTLTFLFIFSVLSPLFVSASGYCGDSLKESKNTFYAEVGGTGYFLSANYDRTFYSGKWLRASTKIGFGFVGIYSIPVEVNLFFGKNMSYEAGIGLAYIRYGGSKNTWVDMTARLGYRYQRRNGGLFFRVGYTPLIDLESLASGYGMQFFHFAGLGVGVTLPVRRGVPASSKVTDSVAWQKPASLNDTLRHSLFGICLGTHIYTTSEIRSRELGSLLDTNNDFSNMFMHNRYIVPVLDGSLHTGKYIHAVGIGYRLGRYEEQIYRDGGRKSDRIRDLNCHYKFSVPFFNKIFLSNPKAKIFPYAGLMLLSNYRVHIYDYSFYVGPDNVHSRTRLENRTFSEVLHFSSGFQTKPKGMFIDIGVNFSLIAFRGGKYAYAYSYSAVSPPPGVFIDSKSEGSYGAFAHTIRLSKETMLLNSVYFKTGWKF